METMILGKTGLEITRTGFGLLPLQRVEMEDGIRILQRAHEGGVTFYDTARGYSHTEEMFGRAFSGKRDSVIIATKIFAQTKVEFLDQLETSLTNLRTDCIDLLQLHNPRVLPDHDDPESAYAGLVEARNQGKARFIGYTSHSLERAIGAVDSGLYDTMQFPLCYISSPEDLALTDRCAAANMGVIAMKPLSGGLLTDLRPAFAFLRQYENVVPIWGIQRMSELEELLEMDANPPTMDEEIQAIIEKDQRELSGQFCRGCGYCLPCPVGITVSFAARMSLLLLRIPDHNFLTDEWRANMSLINDCTECGQCKSRCPYGLDAPALLKKQLAEYDIYYREKKLGDKAK